MAIEILSDHDPINEGFGDLLQQESEPTTPVPAADAGQQVSDDDGDGKTEGAKAAAAAKDEQDTAPAKDGDDEQDAVRKRIDRLTWEKYEARREADRLKAELEAARKAPPAAGVPRAGEQEPKEADFEDYSEYIKALGRFEARRELATREAQLKAEAQKAKTDASRQALHQKLQEGFGKYDDFQLAFQNPAQGGPVVTEAMVDALGESDMPADVLYWLTKNQGESARLAEVGNPVRLGREIAAIEHKIKSARAPEPRATSKAPPPTEPVPNTQSQHEPDFDRMTQDEFNRYHRTRAARAGA